MDECFSVLFHIMNEFRSHVCTAPVRCDSHFKSTVFKLIIQNSRFGTPYKIALGLNATEHHYWEVNIGSDNKLESMLTKVYVAIWHH